MHTIFLVCFVITFFAFAGAFYCVLRGCSIFDNQASGVQCLPENLSLTHVDAHPGEFELLSCFKIELPVLKKFKMLIFCRRLFHDWLVCLEEFSGNFLFWDKNNWISNATVSMCMLILPDV